MINNKVLLLVAIFTVNINFIMSMDDPKDVFLKPKRLSKQEQWIRINLQSEPFEIVLLEAPCPQRVPKKERNKIIGLQKRMLKSLSQGSRSPSPQRR
jgi:hypothetical protein